MSASDLTLPGILHQPSNAVISADHRYRYWLHRSWLGGTGWCVFVMLNPSTADADLDDPTIRRCISFAKRLGCHGVAVVNLFAARSTDPQALYGWNDPTGPENHAYVALAAELAAQREVNDDDELFTPGHLICAWGAQPIARRQEQTALGWIEAAGATPMCLGRTKAGFPRHPLYVAGATPIEVYR